MIENVWQTARDGDTDTVRDVVAANNELSLEVYAHGYPRSFRRRMDHRRESDGALTVAAQQEDLSACG